MTIEIKHVAETFAYGITWTEKLDTKRHPIGTKLYAEQDVRRLQDRIAELENSSQDARSIAAACHEANRLYCLSLGDQSQPVWEEAPQWQVDSAVAGVEFRLANPDAPASSSHEQWLAHKTAEGWVYGATKDADLRTHPCMVPFEELPLEQRMKDVLFGIVCKVMTR